MNDEGAAPAAWSDVHVADRPFPTVSYRTPLTSELLMLEAVPVEGRITP